LNSLSSSDRQFVVRWSNRQRTDKPQVTASVAKQTPAVVDNARMEEPATATVRSSVPIDEVQTRVVDLDANTVELQPFGRINKFSPGTQWYRENIRLVRFAIRGLPEGFTMDVIDPAIDQAGKRRIVKKSYDSLMSEISAAGFTFTKRTELDPNQVLRSGVQYIAVARHPSHGTRHVMTRIRFDDDYTFIFQVSGEIESRVKALVELSDSFVRSGARASVSPPTADMASTTIPKSNSIDAKPGANPLPTEGQIGINRAGNYEYRLEPFGVIGLPKPDFKWRIESKSPPVFIAESTDRSSWLRLSVRQAIAADDQAHGAMLKSELAVVMKKHQQAGDTINDVIEHAHDGDRALMFQVSGLKVDRRFEYEGKLRFDDDYTFFFETFSSGDSPNAGVLGQTFNFFLTDTQAARAPKPNVPKDVVASLSKEIEKLKEIMDMKTPADVEAMVSYVMPPGQLEELKSSGQFDAIVDRLLKQTGPELAYSLNTINWKRVEYDANMDSVTFQNAPFGTTFVRKNGKWNMQF
ncbi:MAG: hypothetical protein WBD31_27255, partial [Rubripirellula sp.]